MINDRDLGEFIVASFDVDNRNCTNAQGYRSFAAARADFQKFVGLDLDEEEEKHREYTDRFIDLLTII